MSEQDTSFTLSSLQHQARSRLKSAGIETAALDARVLLCHACGINETEVIAYPERIIDSERSARFFELVARRARRIPLAHILGVREFYGLEFFVNDQTLVPRPETELAVELAINCAKGIPHQSEGLRFLDLGTGTGCILLSILHEVKDSSGIGIDINPKAVDLAKRNALKLALEARATFRCMDWGDDLEETFDIIVSNPPYILSGELEGLMPEVSRHEPIRALDGGMDGLDQYRKIIPQAEKLLNRQGVLIMEIGDGQATDVLGLLEQNRFQPLDRDVPVRLDLAGRERIITAVKVC